MKNVVKIIGLILCVTVLVCGCSKNTENTKEDSLFTEDLLAKAYDMPDASYERLPDWYGLEYEPMGDWPDGYKNYGFSSEKFQERDIRNVSELGFNFLRVPVNTRFFYEDADIAKAREEYWNNLDELIAWGIQYQVHISLVVCETYGYNCTYTEAEGELFTNDAYMELFLTFWEEIARRYQDVPNNALSFNILNEPADWIGEEQYCELALNAVDRIRDCSPDRLIISDMFAWGTQPLYGLAGSGIVQAIHWYEPRELTNGAPGVSWPYAAPYLKSHIEGSDSITLRGPFEAGTVILLALRGSTVPNSIIASVDGQEIPIAEFSDPVVGKDGCAFIVYDENGQARYANYDIINAALTLDSDSDTIVFYSLDRYGAFDLDHIILRRPGTEETMISVTDLEGEIAIALPATDLTISSGGVVTDNVPANGYTSYDIDWLRDSLNPYADFAAETGTTVFMNEFGSSVTADYDAVLSYIDDMLTVIDEYGWSWSMYDYIGNFGLVKGTNPENIRKGAVYETIGDCQVDMGLYDVLKQHFR